MQKIVFGKLVNKLKLVNKFQPCKVYIMNK